MSEIEELRQRVKALEEENEMLRGHKKRRNYIFPKGFEESYMMDTKYGPRTFIFLNYSEFQSLSRTVRKICFGTLEKPVKRKARNGFVNHTFAIPLEDLTDEQYQKYTMIMKKLVDILYENKCKDRREVEEEST